MSFFADRDDIVWLTVCVVALVVVVALAIALVRAVREQSRAEHPPRERPLPTPPTAPRSDLPPRPLDRP